ncbi:transmembrane protein, putative (macronuclear) [Tetrahymena thermophila SB210]|uniref:Transmembrane protein, putative n=1 Tax=Tetrahymena thermophila (strain SB210) TaxID=312017 RepID=W7XJG2_TETTS|nr:transmembrane protein, putative [Tetrahymena thermophila SB210]EWS74134.1 transmembrane protein, putative [Tetrahymena thermophila SB210]|eukprot:XP_012653319.1 transmembrane protein, putative [Tetrahymena thermophila SB210]
MHFTIQILLTSESKCQYSLLQAIQIGFHRVILFCLLMEIKLYQFFKLPQIVNIKPKLTKSLTMLAQLCKTNSKKLRIKTIIINYLIITIQFNRIWLIALKY